MKPLSFLTEDYHAVIRLTEQAKQLLEKTRMLPKEKNVFQRAQKICEEIQWILEQPNEGTICHLFEMMIVPQMIRLAREVKLHSTLSESRMQKKRAFSQSIQAAKTDKKRINDVIQDLRAVLTS